MISNLLSRIRAIEKHPYIVIGCVILIGAGIRLDGLSSRPFWYDEAIMYWIANGDLQRVLSENAIWNSAPPSFALGLSSLLHIGDTETILRFLPWMGGILGIPAIYFLASQFLSRPVSYFLMLLVAIAPMPVEYSQQLREYSFTLAIAALMLGTFYRYLRFPGWRNWSGMTVLFAASVFVQYGLAILIAALNVVFVIDWYFGERRNRLGRVFQWNISQVVVVGAVIVVYTVSLSRQMKIGFGATSTTNYLANAYWDGMFKTLGQFLVSNTIDQFAFVFPMAEMAMILIGMGVLYAAQSRTGRTALMMLLAPVGLTMIAALARLYPYRGGKQDIFLAPMLLVMLGFGLEGLRQLRLKRWGMALATGAATILIMSSCSATSQYLKGPSRENITPILQVLVSSLRPGDRIYVYYGARPAFTYYNRLWVLPWIEGVSSRGQIDVYFRQIDQIFQMKGRVWLVFSHCFADECEAIPKYAAERRSLELMTKDNGASLYLASE
jgi:hypothetical protein